SEQNAAAIAQICSRLDGIPLAIELAAARVKVLPPAQIAARLDDRFRLLTGGSRTALERHQTLSALIEWSYNLLTEPERVLLRRLSVFAGGWRLEAAQAVCGDGLDADALDTLARLADKSLVVVEERGEATEGRYRLLETIRQYARDKLLESGETPGTRDRHLDFFLHLTEEAEPKLRSAAQLEWLGRLETEHDNLRAALGWALEAGKRDSSLRLAGAAFWFWNVRGYYSEGQKWLDDALALGERASRRVDPTGGDDSSSRTELAQRAKALYGAGLLRYMRVTDLGVARSRMEECLRLWRALEDKWWIAIVLKDLGMMSVMEGDILKARAQFEEGVALAREVEDKWAIAVCLTRLGVALIRVDFPAARPILEEAIAVSRIVGDKSVLWYALLNLSVVFNFQRDYDAAMKLAEETLPAALEIGNQRDILLSRYVIGMGALFQGDEVKAAAFSAEALALAREASYPLGIALAILVLGGVAASAGQPKQAVRLLAAAESLVSGLGINMLTWGDVENVVYKDYMQMARAQLDEAGFETARREGQTLTLEQAIEEAQSV
ncbi:MAG TPA: hypothetical protein VIX58_10625, partial [Anaerolineae bacterium]